MISKNKIKYSLASKARWARWTPEERSAKMKTLAEHKWSNISKEDKHAHAMKMVEARLVKKQNGHN